MPSPRRSPWHVKRESSSARYAFFISHVAEDADTVRALRLAIEERRPELHCFIDVHNWPPGTDDRWVIKETLLQSAFMVAWLTPTYLRSRRGWAWMELAYAELIELSENVGHLDIARPFIVPVFRGLRPEQVARTPWNKYWQRSLVLSARKYSSAQIVDNLFTFYDRQVRERDGG